MSKIITSIVKIDPAIYFSMTGSMLHVVKERGKDWHNDTVFRTRCGRWIRGISAREYQIKNDQRCSRCEAKVDFDEVYRQQVERREQQRLQSRIRDLERGAERARFNALADWDRVCTMIGWQIDEIAEQFRGELITANYYPRQNLRFLTVALEQIDDG